MAAITSRPSTRRRRSTASAAPAALKRCRPKSSRVRPLLRGTGEPAPKWFRGATAEYSPSAIAMIRKLGFKIAGFSINGDGGSLLGAKETARRIAAAKDGDVIIAHINQPTHAAGEGVLYWYPRGRAGRFWSSWSPLSTVKSNARRGGNRSRPPAPCRPATHARIRSNASLMAAEMMPASAQFLSSP